MGKDGESSEEPGEGWEALASEEPGAGSLAPSPELEEALREAAEAVEARADARKADVPNAPLVAVPQEVHEKVLAQLEELQQQLDAAADQQLRLQADYENHRKRTLKERQDAHAYGHEGLVRDLLGTVDNLDRALEAANQSETANLQSMLQGVELVRRELLGVLSTHAVTLIEAEGQLFDPNLHEAMAQKADDSVPPGTVVEVLQAGYQLRDRLLRPSRVVVSRKPEEGSTEEPTEDEAGQDEAGQDNAE